MALDKCNHCGNEIPPHIERCPHCALPGLFPNVRAAERPEEKKALTDRYQESIEKAISRGCQDVVKDFEAAISSSQAVITRSITETSRLISSDKQLNATYYELLEAGVRLPSGNEWDAIREVVDSALFPYYKKYISFGALSLEGIGFSNYGECSLILDEHMIAHRATVFEENSIIFMKKHNISMSKANELPPGYRALWAERNKLCIAKLADNLSPTTGKETYPEILMKEGKTSTADSFVEVHIWGPMTKHTLKQLLINNPKRKTSRVILKAMSEELKKININTKVA